MSEPFIGREWLIALEIIKGDNIGKCINLNLINEVELKDEFKDVFTEKLGSYNKKDFIIQLKN